MSVQDHEDVKVTHDRGKSPANGLPGSRAQRNVGSAEPRGGAPLISVAETFSATPPKVWEAYPKGFIDWALERMGRPDARRMLHACSGSLHDAPGTRVDIRPDAEPDIVADGRALPFAASLGVCDKLLEHPLVHLPLFHEPLGHVVNESKHLLHLLRGESVQDRNSGAWRPWR